MVVDVWEVIPEFPDYSVGASGVVRRDHTGRLLVPKVNQYGNVYVGLMKDNKQRQRSLPLLVAQAFIPQPSEVFDTPINLNGERFDCMVDNLVWRPRWFAKKYNRQFRKHYHTPIEKPIVDQKSGQEYRNSWDCAVTHGLLEKDVVVSIMERTYVWPTYQQLAVLEK